MSAVDWLLLGTAALIIAVMCYLEKACNHSWAYCPICGHPYCRRCGEHPDGDD